MNCKKVSKQPFKIDVALMQNVQGEKKLCNLM